MVDVGMTAARLRHLLESTPVGSIRRLAEPTAAFFWTRAKYVALRRVGNVLVRWHVQTTPQRSTDDTLREMVQENLAYLVRRVEFTCHSLQMKYEALGKEILHESGPE